MKLLRIITIYISILVLTGSFKISPLFAQKELVKEEPGRAQEDKKEGEPKEAKDKKQEGENKKGEKEQGKEEVKKALTFPAPVLEIKRLEAEEPLYSIELRDVELVDFFRVIAHDYNFNILIDKDTSGKITASFTNITLEEALEGIAEMSNLVLHKKGNLIKVTPNLITKTLVLNYIEAKKILESSQAQAAAAPAAQAAAGGAIIKQESTIYDLLSDKGKVLLGKQPNSLIVIDYPTNIEKIEGYLKGIDQKMATRVFKLKFLKANEIAGQPATTGTTTSTSGTATTSTTGTTTSSSKAGG